MSTEKLPEWPEKPRWDDKLLDKYHYEFHRAEAALARMEALAKMVRFVTCDAMHHEHKDRHRSDEVCPLELRRDALLAACEQKEAGR